MSWQIERTLVLQESSSFRRDEISGSSEKPSIQADVLREKWLSMLKHIVNKHSWKSSYKFKFVKKCGLAPMSRREKKSITWLKKGFPALVALEEVITNQKLLKNLAKLTEFHHTGQIRVLPFPYDKICTQKRALQL